MSSQSIPAILVDTSFLLPTLGFDVDNELVYDAMKEFTTSAIGICYSDMSLLEASWQAVRAMKRNEFDQNTFRTGIRSIENELSVICTLKTYRPHQFICLSGGSRIEKIRLVIE